MSIVLAPGRISALGSSLIQALLYADVFDHPLTLEEAYARCSHPEASEEKVRQVLQELVNERYVYSEKGFYAVRPAFQLVEKRLERNQTAERYLGPARLISRCIGAFPYVRAVFLSGSISKGCMDRESDIDYFVITEPGRLWVAKTLLFVVRKLMPKRFIRKYLCLNYFIDRSHLEIEEKNWFTATEIMTVVPAYGAREYLDFLRSNGWVTDYYPHAVSRSLAGVPFTKVGIVKGLMEKLLGGNWGNRLEARFRTHMTHRHRSKEEFSHLKAEDLSVALKTDEHIAKLHSKHHQKRVLTLWHEKIRQFEQQHQLILERAHG